MMRVKDLLSILNDVDPDDDVILSADEEGNKYSQLARVSFGGIFFRPYAKQAWEGEILGSESYDEDEDPMPDEARPCVVLYPVH